jgi:hypothetical protein
VRDVTSTRDIRGAAASRIVRAGSPNNSSATEPLMAVMPVKHYNRVVLAILVILTVAPVPARAEVHAGSARDGTDPAELSEGKRRREEMAGKEREDAAREAEQRRRKLEQQAAKEKEAKERHERRKQQEASRPATTNEKNKWTEDSARAYITGALPPSYPVPLADGTRSSFMESLAVGASGLSYTSDGVTRSYNVRDVEPGSVQLSRDAQSNPYARRITFWYNGRGFREGVRIDLPYLIDIEVAQKVTDAFKAWATLARGR